MKKLLTTLILLSTILTVNAGIIPKEIKTKEGFDISIRIDSNAENLESKTPCYDSNDRYRPWDCAKNKTKLPDLKLKYAAVIPVSHSACPQNSFTCDFNLKSFRFNWLYVVYDEDKGKDDFIGRVRINTRDMGRYNKLTIHNKRGEEVGYLTINKPSELDYSKTLEETVFAMNDVVELTEELDKNKIYYVNKVKSANNLLALFMDKLNKMFIEDKQVKRYINCYVTASGWIDADHKNLSISQKAFSQLGKTQSNVWQHASDVWSKFGIKNKTTEEIPANEDTSEMINEIMKDSQIWYKYGSKLANCEVPDIK
jgi:hypothetical protein